MNIMKIACLLLFIALATATLSSTMPVFAAASKPISTDKVFSMCSKAGSDTSCFFAGRPALAYGYAAL